MREGRRARQGAPTTSGRLSPALLAADPGVLVGYAYPAPISPQVCPGCERVSYWYVLIATTDRNPTSVRVDTQGSFRNTGPGERPGARALSAPTELEREG